MRPFDRPTKENVWKVRHRTKPIVNTISPQSMIVVVRLYTVNIEVTLEFFVSQRHKVNRSAKAF